MSTSSIRVLVVDDSAVIREIICDAVNGAAGMEVVGTASDGRHALELIEKVKPDVVTLDVQMPRMDGLAMLDALLATNPLPVVMVSSLTRLGAQVTLDALDRGAVDYVTKPGGDKDGSDDFRDEVVRKIRVAAGTDVRRILDIRNRRKQRQAERPPRLPAAKPQASEVPPDLADKCIAIGISTGGPPVLSFLFESFRPPMPPIVVVQHMPERFTGPLAWRLNSISALTIHEARDGDTLRPNHVLIAPGGKHLRLRAAGRTAKVSLFDGAVVSGHKPSIDVMMTSAASVFRSRVMAILMTGMGRDGSDGCKAVRMGGGYALGQDEASSAVYGMNKVAWVEGNIDRQFALADAPSVIVQQMRRMWPERAVAAAR